MEEKIYTIDYILENNIDKTAYGFIYITTNMINGKIYIGQRKFTPRWKTYLGSGTVFIKALKKYNRENFNRNIVAVAYNNEELNLVEVDYIKFYKAVESDGYYNIADGGRSGNKYAGKTKEEMKIIKQKMSDMRKGNKNNFYGKHHSAESKQQMSIAKIGKKYSNEINMKKGNKGKQNGMYGKGYLLKGENNRMYGKHHTEETKMKMRKPKSEEAKRHISEASIGKILSEETKKKISINSINAKSTICITTHQVFNSTKKGSEFYNCDSSGVTKCCKNKLKSCGKLKDGTPLKWMYYEDYLKLHNN